MHFSYRRNKKGLFTYIINSRLNTTQCAMKRTQFEETDFSAANDGMVIHVKKEYLFEWYNN